MTFFYIFLGIIIGIFGGSIFCYCIMLKKCRSYLKDTLYSTKYINVVLKALSFTTGFKQYNVDTISKVKTFIDNKLDN